MLYCIAHCLMYCSWVRSMPVCCDLIGNMANHSNGLLKKPFGGLHIPLLAQPRIHQIATMINGSIEIAPFSVDLDVRFVHVPGSPSLTPSFYSQLVRNQGSKPR